MTQMIEQPQSRDNGRENLPALAPPRLPYHPALEERFGIDKASWKALVEAIFPNAQSVESVILALSYCRARKLDPFKRNVHIVPIWDSNRGGMVDTIWPGIGELRTTAFRTGEYAGRDATEFGTDITKSFTGMVGRRGQERQVTVEVKFPEWAQVTVYRMVRGERRAFAGPRVYWEESYATQGKSDVPNEMWTSRPRGQIDKCAEAASLRAAFPEEIGNDYIADEVGSRRAGGQQVIEQAAPPAKGLADRLKRELPETQLPDDEANAIIEQRARESSAPSPGAAATEPAPPAGEAEAEQTPVEEGIETVEIRGMPVRATLSYAARRAEAFVDGVVDIAKPEGLTMKQARAKFHELHKPSSWSKLEPEVQDELYRALLNGDVFKA